LLTARGFLSVGGVNNHVFALSGTVDCYVLRVCVMFLILILQVDSPSSLDAATTMETGPLASFGNTMF
jgi:hypothetical protein